MGDKPEASGIDSGNSNTHNNLLGSILGKPFALRRAIEATSLLPTVLLAQVPAATGDQRRAIRFYEQTKFPESEDQTAAPSNAKALELAKKNILLHTDADPTIQNGRISEVKLTDPAEKAQLSGWLLFPYAYKDAERTLAATGNFTPKEARFHAAFQQEGFRLFMKQEGFDVDGNPIAKGLTATEQLKLDCLTFRSLSAQKEFGGQPLTALEEKALTDAAGRLNTALASDKPDEFIKKLKGALDDCSSDEDRKTLLIGLTALLSDKKLGKPLIDSFESWLSTKYTDALDQMVYKDPEKMKKWLATNGEPDKADNFPKNPKQEDVLKWVRQLDDKALSDRVRETMTALATPADQGAFQDLLNLVLGQKDRFGARAGIFKGLNDLAARKDGDPHMPADTEKVVAALTEAARDPAAVKSNARPPGEFVPNPVVTPEEAQPAAWHSWVRNTGGNALMVGLGWLALDWGVAGLGKALIPEFANRALGNAGLGRPMRGWTLRTVRDTAGVVTGGRVGGGGATSYEPPSEEDLVTRSNRRTGRAADPAVAMDPLIGTETVDFRGMEIVLPDGRTARDVARQLRRLENDRDFRTFLNEQIRDARDPARRDELRQRRDEYLTMEPHEQARARAQVIEEVANANIEVFEMGAAGERTVRRVRAGVGLTLLGGMALLWAIKSLGQEQPPAPPLAVPKAKTKD